MKKNDLLTQAFEIARVNLNACLHPLGIINGTHHFTDLWARDSLFATYGLQALGNMTHTHKTLMTFLNHQRRDGLIPYRILRSLPSVAKYQGRPRFLKRPIGNFRSYQTGGLVLDGGLLTIITAAEYIKQSRDHKFLNDHYFQLIKAANWYRQRFGDRLLSEWLMCEWADAVYKSGKTLYSNILYWKSLVSMKSLAKQAQRNKDAEHFANLAVNVGNRLVKEFWTGTHFADWMHWRRHDYFYSHGNLLAVWWGMTDKKQTRSILQQAATHWTGWTVKENHPRYPWWRIPLLNHLLGVADYHNQGGWLQPGLNYVLALNTAGKSKEARQRLADIAGQIVSHQGVYEIYEPDGRPLKRLFYQAEYPFAWSAGLFVYAYRLLQKI